MCTCTSPHRARPVPAPTGGAARLTFIPPTSLCPFFVSQLYVWDANSPSVTKKSQHDHARSYHPLLIPHLRTISVVPQLVVSALTGEMGDWECLSPAEFSQLQQYSECEYLTTRSLSPLTSGRLVGIGIDFGAVRWIRMDERFYRSIYLVLGHPFW